MSQNIEQNTARLFQVQLALDDLNRIANDELAKAAELGSSTKFLGQLHQLTQTEIQLDTVNKLGTQIEANSAARFGAGTQSIIDNLLHADTIEQHHANTVTTNTDKVKAKASEGKKRYGVFTQPQASNHEEPGATATVTPLKPKQ